MVMPTRTAERKSGLQRTCFFPAAILYDYVWQVLTNKKNGIIPKKIITDRRPHGTADERAARSRRGTRTKMGMAVVLDGPSIGTVYGKGVGYGALT